jgi:hypothetical protein
MTDSDDEPSVAIRDSSLGYSPTVVDGLRIGHRSAASTARRSGLHTNAQSRRFSPQVLTVTGYATPRPPPQAHKRTGARRQSHDSHVAAVLCAACCRLLNAPARRGPSSGGRGDLRSERHLPSAAHEGRTGLAGCVTRQRESNGDSDGGWRYESRTEPLRVGTARPPFRVVTSAQTAAQRVRSGGCDCRPRGCLSRPTRRGQKARGWAEPAPHSEFDGTPCLTKYFRCERDKHV